MGAGAAQNQDQNRRDAILEAALDLFADRGFEGTSVAAVATQADVAKPLVAYHFGSKEGLWQAAVDLVISRVNQRLKEFADERTALDLHGNRWLRHFLRGVMIAVREEPAYARLSFQEGGLQGPRLDYLAERHFKPSAKIMQPLYEELRRRGVLPDGPDFSMQTIVLGLVERPVAFAPAMEQTFGTPTLTDGAIDAHLDVIMQLLVNHKGR